MSVNELNYLLHDVDCDTPDEKALGKHCVKRRKWLPAISLFAKMFSTIW